MLGFIEQVMDSQELHTLMRILAIKRWSFNSIENMEQEKGPWIRQEGFMVYTIQTKERTDIKLIKQENKTPNNSPEENT